MDSPDSSPDRIVCDPTICHGNPCIRGTRVLVTVIQDSLKAGVPVDAILANYPTLTNEDVEAARHYNPPRQR